MIGRSLLPSSGGSSDARPRGRRVPCTGGRAKKQFGALCHACPSPRSPSGACLSCPSQRATRSEDAPASDVRTPPKKKATTQQLRASLRSRPHVLCHALLVLVASLATVHYALLLQSLPYCSTADRSSVQSYCYYTTAVAGWRPLVSQQPPHR